LSKHRRPSKLQQLGQFSKANASPLHLGVAAGVAGTLSITGTVVAQAAPSHDASHRNNATTLRTAPVAHSSEVATDLSNSQNVLVLQGAVTDERQERVERIARAKARAEAKAKRLAEKKAAERREARQRAAAARQLQTASRSVERMSASAAHVLEIARDVASGAYYTHGGAGPTGFDCSGFTSYVFSKVGISLPHSSSMQAGVATRVSSPQPGDLVFVYNGGGGSIGHVAIYAGNGYWWEAANPSYGVGLHRAWSSAVSYGRVL
jgi:cell wall-associated NlpC family hydrolase